MSLAASAMLARSMWSMQQVSIFEKCTQCLEGIPRDETYPGRNDIYRYW